jgi:hypothetical protein
MDASLQQGLSYGFRYGRDGRDVFARRARPGPLRLDKNMQSKPTIDVFAEISIWPWHSS